MNPKTRSLFFACLGLLFGMSVMYIYNNFIADKEALDKTEKAQESSKIYDYKKFYEARGNVKILTSDGQRFATQSVFWDQKKNRIYTRDTVYATMEDGSTLVHANGMTAKDDFSEYKFFNNSGDLDVSKAKIAQPRP